MTHYRFLALEKRILFDASIAAVVADAAAKQAEAPPPRDLGVAASQPTEMSPRSL